ncbi:MAG: hypothetical protein KC455_09630 [Carnobacterium sp.]|nr:hypothetical protein [Carnobacterium sp.]
MNREEKIEEAEIKNKFPWGAMGIFIVVFIGSTFIELFTMDVGLFSGEDTGTLVTGGIIGLVTGTLIALIGVSIQYIFTKFPVQWISKEKEVYKYDIWTAIFYSSSIGAVINILVQQLNYQENILASSIVSIISTCLFLFFYFSGSDKKSRVKRAMIIVQIVWLVIGLGIGIFANHLLTDLMV